MAGVLDLARTSVFLDWDGTVTVVDTGVHLLERLGPPAWRDLDDAYRRGEIGSRECLARQWALLPAEEARLRAVAAEVPLDPGFGALAAGLRAAGAEVTVVSDGWGFYLEEACAALGLAVLSNTVDWSTGDLRFPHRDRCCPCDTCGTCKQAPVRDARRRGRRTVFVGDGVSDRKAALLADVVFAKGDLAEWCDDLDVPYRPFGALDDVRRALLGGC